MTRRAHLAVWCLLWLGGLLAWPVWVGPERLAALVAAEARAVDAVFGPRVSPWVLSSAGACGERVAAPMPPLPGGLRRVAGAWRGEVCLVSLRLAGLAAWGLFLLPVAFAAAIDGLATRAIRADTFGERNPAAFAVSGHLLIAALMSSVLLAIAPVPWPAGWGAAWLLLAAWPLRMALVHLPPVFTR